MTQTVSSGALVLAPHEAGDADLRVPRTSRAPWRGLVATLCLLAVVLMPSSPRVAPATLPSEAAPPRDAPDELRSASTSIPDPDHPGAQAHRGGPRLSLRPAAIAPAVEPPREDWVPFPAGRECRTADPGPPLEVCGEATPWPPRKRIVVVGDSHAQQYSGALEVLAAERHWQVVRMLRGACPFSTESEVVRGAPGCLAWNAAARKQIAAMRPDLVITTATRDVRVGLTETMPPGFVRAWRELDADGIPVLAIRDNPRFARAPADCVREEGAASSACAVPRRELLSPVAPYRRARDVPPNVTFVDVSDYLCTPTTCPAVVGNVLVYFDANHLSATFTRTLGPVFVDYLEPLLDCPAARPHAPRGAGR